MKQPQKELQQLEALQDALLHALRRPGVAQQTIEIGLSRFTDAGAEVLVKVGAEKNTSVNIRCVLVQCEGSQDLVSIQYHAAWVDAFHMRAFAPQGTSSHDCIEKCLTVTMYPGGWLATVLPWHKPS